MRHAGLEHLEARSFHPVRDDGLVGGGAQRPIQPGESRRRTTAAAFAARPGPPQGQVIDIVTWESWLYLTTMIDIAARRIACYALADSLAHRTDRRCPVERGRRRRL